MMRSGALLTLAAFLLMGCGQSEPDEVKATKDSPEAQAAMNQASEKWTPEQQVAFRKALKRARTGEEGNGQAGSGVQPTTTYPQGTANDPDNPAVPGAPAAATPSSPSTAPSVNSGRPNDIGSTGSDPMVGK